MKPGLSKTAFQFLFVSPLVLLHLSGAAQTPGTLLWDGDRLALLKKTWKQDSKTGEMVKDLQNQANHYIDMKPVSVMDKASTPESGTKHDYMSQAPYFWYDSSKPNGKPYMRKDGQHNPETYLIADHKNLADLSSACQALSAAWYITGDDRYAEKASALLRYWFLDDATKMNPNLNYAQAIPGVNNGRGIGIIETIPLIGIADASRLLEGSKSWTPGDQKALQGWYSQYLNWLLNSKNGQDEHASKNNHGTWYYAQAVDFALFTGNKTKAAELVNQCKQILDNQIEKDGKMPLELERTNGLAYSTYNLQGWFRLANFAKKTGTDLWNYRNPKGAGIRTALDWLKPYALGEKPWTYQQIGEYKKDALYGVLLEAADKYNDPVYAADAKRLGAEAHDKVADLFYGQPPRP